MSRHYPDDVRGFWDRKSYMVRLFPGGWNRIWRSRGRQQLPDSELIARPT